LKFGIPKDDVYATLFSSVLRIFFADALLCIAAPLNASEIEIWVGDPRATLSAVSSDIVLEKFHGGVANGAADFKNVFLFPVTRILSRTFHCVIIISRSLAKYNRAKE